MNLWSEMKLALKVTVCAAVLLGLPTVLMLSCIDDIFFAKEVMPPPVEDVATVESAEIVTGVCTFGDCPVSATATTLPPTTESLTTVNLAKQTQNLTTAEAAENNGSRENSAPGTQATSQNAETTSQNEAVADSATTEPETEPLTAEPETEEESETEHTETAAIYTASYFRQMGVIWWNGWRWTWYSERVLPGSGLNIPGRYTEGGYVRDGEGYICLASDALDYGAVIETPFGTYGKVYDCGCGYDTIDVYVGW